MLASNLTCSNGCTDPPVYIHGYLVEVGKLRPKSMLKKRMSQGFHATDFEIDEWNNYLTLEVEGDQIM